MEPLRKLVVEFRRRDLVNLVTTMTDGSAPMQLLIHRLKRIQVKLVTVSRLDVYVLKVVPSYAKVLVETVGGG